MPLFVCYRGDFSHLALAEEGAFAITDTRGRPWLCYRSPLPHLCGTTLQEALAVLPVPEGGAADEEGNLDTGVALYDGEPGDLPALLGM